MFGLAELPVRLFLLSQFLHRDPEQILTFIDVLKVCERATRIKTSVDIKSEKDESKSL